MPGLDTSKITTDSQTRLIFIIVVLVFVLVLNNVRSNKKIFSLSKKKKTIRKIPTAKYLLPVRLPVLDSIYTMVKFRKDGIQFIERLSEQYGNLVEVPFGPFMVTLVSDPVIIQKLLSSTQLAHVNRPEIHHSIFGDIFHNGLLTSENEIWVAQRKMLDRSFSYKSLQTFASFMNTHAANLTSILIHECKDDGKKVGIGETRINQLLNRHSLKIIAQIVMGTDRLSSDEINEVCEKFNSLLDLVSDKVLNPWKYMWLLPKRSEYNRVHKYLNEFFIKITDKYMKEYEQMKITSAGQKSTHAAVDRDIEVVGVKPFRCLIEEMICNGLVGKEIYEQVGTLLIGGHGTTFAAIRLLMLHLALNPDHQAACREEIDKAITEKGYKYNTSRGSEEIESFDLTLEDLHDLKYLERCILESGRLTSVVPIFLRRIDAPLNIDDDLEFPAGTNFVISNWTMHQNPKIYPNPLKFDPDRFLADNVKKRHPYSYPAFSLGPRNCIGRKVAIMQIKVIISYILHHFEIFSDDKLEDVKLHFGITIVPEREYRVVLKPLY